MAPTNQLETISNQILNAANDAPNGQKFIVAIVGAPGAGKSTLSAALCDKLGSQAITVPQDGFHLDNEQLIRTDQMAIKGAPTTFDIDGLSSTLSQLRKAQQPVYFPIFDRPQDLARAAAGAVLPEHKIIFVEGNYLLLDHTGWSELKQYFDLTIALDINPKTLEQRLTQRWQDLGLSQDEVTQKVVGNDLPNGRVVQESFVHADLIVGEWVMH